MLRVFSQLSQELEVMVHDTIGHCIEVHRQLGPGLLETVYSRALAVELRVNNIPFEREKVFPVMYRDAHLCDHHLDFVVGGQVILEIKSVDQLANVHHSQLLHYMRLSKLPVGLLIKLQRRRTKERDREESIVKTVFVYLRCLRAFVVPAASVNVIRGFGTLPLRLQLFERHPLHCSP